MSAHTQRIRLQRHHIDFTVSAASDVGRVRRVNEDSFLATAPIFAVADGMGGHSRGEEASHAVVTALSQLEPGRATSPGEVAAALARANADIIAGHDDTSVAGSTVAGLALVTLTPGADDGHWMAFNIGDSRVYRWTGNHLSQVTVDHSLVQELIDAGTLSRDDAEHHPERNVITRAVGVGHDADPDAWVLPIAERELFLLCSDGLIREVPMAEIEEIVRRDPALAAEELIARALAAGARDNVTALVVEAVTSPTQQPEPGYPDERTLGVLEETVPRIRGTR